MNYIFYLKMVVAAENKIEHPNLASWLTGQKG